MAEAKRDFESWRSRCEESHARQRQVQAELRGREILGDKALEILRLREQEERRVSQRAREETLRALAEVGQERGLRSSLLPDLARGGGGVAGAGENQRGSDATSSYHHRREAARHQSRQPGQLSRSASSAAAFLCPPQSPSGFPPRPGAVHWRCVWVWLRLGQFFVMLFFKNNLVS